MVLVFGGSFNPPTLAHEAIIEKLYEQLKPEKIVVVPTGNYFTWKNDLIAFEHRYQMVSLMTSDFNYCIVSDIENTDNFLGSYHTLKVLSTTYDDLYFVVGADHIKTLTAWKNYELLVKTFKFIILTRNNYELDTKLLEKMQLKYKVIDFQSDISSSTIRSNLHQHLDLLNPKVKDYILSSKLYIEVIK